MPLQQLSLNATTRSLYGENDELEVTIGVSGLAFSGSLVAFDDHRKLTAISKMVLGFPKSLDDTISFDYGIFDRLKVRLTANAKGHVSVTAVLEKWGGPTAEYQETMSVQFWSDLSSVDEFCRSISAFEPGVPSEARLLGRSADH